MSKRYENYRKIFVDTFNGLVWVGAELLTTLCKLFYLLTANIATLYL